jgi:hypothetical protein
VLLKLLLELLLLELLLELDEDTDVSSSSFLTSADCWAWANINFGAFFKNSRKPSVKGPRPIDVKKLIAYLVFRTLSCGNIPLYHSI